MGEINIFPLTALTVVIFLVSAGGQELNWELGCEQERPMAGSWSTQSRREDR